MIGQKDFFRTIYRIAAEKITFFIEKFEMFYRITCRLTEQVIYRVDSLC